MYTIEYYPIAEINKLKKDWMILQNGNDMTYFQQYAWYEVLSNINASTIHKHFYLLFAKVAQDDNTILIAPLWIIKKTFRKFNRKGVYFWGKGLWADYLNIIYDKFEAKAVDFLLTDIKQRYGVDLFSFDEVSEDTEFYKYIVKRYGNESNERTTCVELTIPNTLEDYHKKLSKNARQNIRTAYNRISKDGIELLFNYDDSSVNIEEFNKYRNIRLQKKILKINDWKLKIRCFISKKILNRGLYQFPTFSPYLNNPDIHFITCKTSKGELCSAFCYGIDSKKKKIVLMAVATNPLFYRYSLGILSIYSFVIKQIESKEYVSIDFSRGNEKYKSVLGGLPHFNSKIEFKL